MAATASDTVFVAPSLPDDWQPQASTSTGITGELSVRSVAGEHDELISWPAPVSCTLLPAGSAYITYSTRVANKWTFEDEDKHEDVGESTGPPLG